MKKQLQLSIKLFYDYYIMIQIKQNQQPKLKRPEFSVDSEINPKLNKYEITSLMNKSNFTLFLGKSGSGKSSLLISLLNTPCLFRKCYHTIILFCPSGSRNSIKNDFWDYLPQEQIYDEVTPENLQEAYDVAQSNSEDGYTTLMIFDDVQKYLKENQKMKSFYCIFVTIGAMQDYPCGLLVKTLCRLVRKLEWD